MKNKGRIGKDIIGILIATFYLLLYVVFLQYSSTRFVALLMLGFAPIILTLMVLAVLILGKHDGKKLNGEEFGYSDKNKDDLDVF